MLARGIRCEFGALVKRAVHNFHDRHTCPWTQSQTTRNAFEMPMNARPIAPHTARAARATRQRAFGERSEAERRSLASRVRWGAGSARVGQVHGTAGTRLETTRHDERRRARSQLGISSETQSPRRRARSQLGISSETQRASRIRNSQTQRAAVMYLIISHLPSPVPGERAVVARRAPRQGQRTLTGPRAQ